MARIAVDMDEVIADALGEHIDRYNKNFNARVQRDDLIGRSLRQFVPATVACDVEKLVHTEDFFADLAVFPHAYDVLLKLSYENEIFIATAAMEVPLSFDAKYKWLLKHFPFISPMNFVFCGDKSILNADYLIDDNARHFERFNGTGILFDAPHNQHVTGYRRVKNWLEVAEIFS
ncbi:MAG: 5'-3'-deoxyribonucleotidase [Candidatus Obscuribacter sp.]|nr:5'-3'-deoxyribonucleotidase [Candidatus Obscuribacter sp.]